MLLPQFIREGAAALEALYPPEEARSLVLRLAVDVGGFEPYDYVVRPDAEVPEELSNALGRLLEGEPLQYVTGFQEFCGRCFRVTPDVLIPRPETEMLVETAVARLSQVNDSGPGPKVLELQSSDRGVFEGVRPLIDSSVHSPGPKVLDLCTGSGCIAWSIAMGVPGSEVTGVDISEAALAVARAQFSGDSGYCSEEGEPSHALRMTKERRSLSFRPSEATLSFRPGEASGEISFPRADVPAPSMPRFLQADVLSVPETFLGAPFDVITANPPYIRESEKTRMHRNVLEHEPELALFVPDEDPLLFYRAVAEWARRFLKSGGWGIVEINEELGSQTRAVFEAAGLKNVKIEPDFFGKERFVCFEKTA